MSDQTRSGDGDVVRRRGGRPSIPIGFRPAPSDDELETNVLERWQGWGLLVTLFMAVFLPAYWLYFEPARIDQAALEQRAAMIVKGAKHFAKDDLATNPSGFNCARCHGADARGGVVAKYRAPGTTVDQLNIPAPNLRAVFKRQMVDQKKTAQEAYRFVYETIAKGRPGTPMPTWGLAYGGGLNDQQIEAVIDFLMSIQEGLPEETKLAIDAAPGGFSRLIAFGAAHR